MGLFKNIFGANAYSNRELKRIEPIKNKVLELDEEYQALSDAELKAKTAEFKERLEDGETLDDILPEALATVREAAWRVLEKKPYPVQIIGAIVLHQGRIAEMKTGEGKTLVACVASYLNALTGLGVHVVTVNDYLAKTQAEEMGKVLRWLGLTVGCILHGLNNEQRRAAYNCDVTYATNNELGFDYLRDNMVTHKEDRVQRAPNFAIVDEVDSILIDEARTPLIISGRGDKSTELYSIVDRFAKTLTSTTVVEMDDKVDQESINDTADYIIDEKAKTATITQRGVKKAEQAFRVENLMDSENMTLLHHINQAIKANGVMKNDIDYVVKDGEIIIVDEFTGRLMMGRRFNDGLHQAIEAKEGVKIKSESKTLATITFQNFFRLYTKLSGMTGTAMTEEDEFKEIYKLDVIAIPTNKPVIRIDHNDQVYTTEKGKYAAIIDKIIECHEKGQPILVGTVSIEKSELLSAMLKRKGIKHEVLNAKQHAKEAEIVAQAGKYGAVTIATNMAGRGTDIILGGNPEFMAKSEMRKKGFTEELIAEATGYAETDNEDIIEARRVFHELEQKHKEEIAEEAKKVREAGGLYIIGTERHESRRIDNQLRGRAGRQGDPGKSRFYLSAEDELLRLFAGDRFYMILDTFNVDDDMPLETKMLTNLIEGAQKKVEGNNFAARRQVLNFDDVMNKQREVIYGQRNQILDGVDLDATITKMIDDYFNQQVDFYCPSALPKEEWNVQGMLTKLAWVLDGKDETGLSTADDFKKLFLDCAHKRFDERKEKYGAEIMAELERKILLANVDRRWMDHIDEMEDLKNGIYLRSYGQQDPVVAFRLESFDMFDEMSAAICEGTVTGILTVILRTNEEVKREEQAKITGTSGATDGSEKKHPVKKEKKIGRNDPCPCGSGKKYKHCCGKDE